MNTAAKKTPPTPPGAGGSRGGSEIQAWIDSLEKQNKSIGKRNRVLSIVLIAGVLLLLAVLWWLYQSGVRSYAVLENVQFSRHPANQGRILISFDVTVPGKVYLHRQSGAIETEVIDYFNVNGSQQRQWSWIYEPGEPIDVSMVYRGSLWRKSRSESFDTARQADIVILIDTTGSMSRSIATLQDKCSEFSEALTAKQLQHRFALIGFGDRSEGDWVDRHEFTDDVRVFQERVASIKRFDGGDLPESALDALENALTLPFDGNATRRFYLVTDAQFHSPSGSGADEHELIRQLEEKNVLLSVFTREEFRADYEQLTTDTGRVQTIEDFGQVLSEGRILED